MKLFPESVSPMRIAYSLCRSRVMDSGLINHGRIVVFLLIFFNLFTLSNNGE